MINLYKLYNLPLPDKREPAILSRLLEGDEHKEHRDMDCSDYHDCLEAVSLSKERISWSCKWCKKFNV